MLGHPVTQPRHVANPGPWWSLVRPWDVPCHLHEDLALAKPPVGGQGPSRNGARRP